MAIKQMLGRVALDRAKGERASVARALLASCVVGAAVTVLTYRLLRK